MERKEKNFKGFVIYRIAKDGSCVLIRTINGNTFSDYREAVEVCYDEPTEDGDLYLLTLPNENCPTWFIFCSTYIGTEHEFDRDTFQNMFYGI
ncbi:MAG: hypothetical protein ACI4TD_04445 [Phocaeicola sp.]